MAYERINWQNEPSEATALNDVNLNKMDSAIYELDGKATTTETAITALQDGKVDKVNGKGLSQVDNVTVTQHVAYGTVVSTIKTYKQDGTEVTSQVCNGINVDSALSNSSTNPVQNKVVKSAIDEKSTVAISDTLETGTTLANITIDGTTTAIKGSDIEVDEELSPTSTNPVENKAIYDALNNLLPSKTVSGNPISISDASGFNAKALKLTMNPIQDLHGYSNPWAGGAGKNILNTNVFNDTEYFEINSDGSITQKKADGRAENNMQTLHLSAGTYIFSRGSTNGTCRVYGLIGGSWVTFVNNTNESTTITLSEACDLYIKLSTNGTFPAVFYPMITLSTVTDQTFAPYSNICPISGRTEASVKRTGKNLFDNTATESGYINSTGNVVSPAAPWLHEFIKIIGGLTYTVSGCNENTSVYHVWYDKNMNFISNFSRHVNGTFTAPNNAGYMGICAIEMANASHDLDTIQVEIGSTATAYEPYTAETKTHQYSDTIYGGVDDFNSGNMSITKKAQRFGDMDWTYHSAGGVYSAYFDAYFPEDSITGQGYVSADIITERYKSVPSANIATTGYDNGVMALASNTRRFIVCDTNFTDATTFKTTLADVIVVYPLDTPTTISTSAEEITLLKGNNVLSTNADDMELKYSVSLDSLLHTETRTLAKSVAPIEEEPIVDEPKEETDETEEQR